MKSRNTPESVCVICGSWEYIEQNHAGGRNHIPWFKVPFCERHHRMFHRQLESVGINLRYIPNQQKRLASAAVAFTIGLWMILQALMESLQLPKKKN